MAPVPSRSVRRCNTWDHLTPSGAPRREPNAASAHWFAASSYPFATWRATRCPALLRATRRACTDTATGQLAA
jgi:polyisoprenoid-binding protein YceI